MKRYFKFLFLSMLVMSMQGCSKDLVITDEPNAPEENESVQLRLTGNVAYMTPETRLNANGFVNNDLFGVYTTTGKMGSNKKADPENARYIYKDGNIEAADESNTIYWENNKSMKIYAYYPHDGSDTNTFEAHSFAVKTSQNIITDYYKSDFLRAESDAIAKTSNPVEITFYHLMSKISVTINHDDSFTDSEFKNITTKELTIVDVATSGIINLKDRTLSAPKTFGKTITALANGDTFSAIIFPQNRNDVKFRLKLGDDYYSSTINIAYDSGKEYKYTFTVTKNEGALTLKSAKIEGWGDGGSIDGGKMNQENTNSN
ncbi:MAG: fimbrillin family protein [Alistipes sp.]|nr:fimbrillin family protein [Alistipes sp.]